MQFRTPFNIWWVKPFPMKLGEDIRMLNVNYNFIILTEDRDLTATVFKEQLVGCHTAYQHVRMCLAQDFIFLTPSKTVWINSCTRRWIKCSYLLLIHSTSKGHKSIWVIFSWVNILHICWSTWSHYNVSRWNHWSQAYNSCCSPDTGYRKYDNSTRKIYLTANW